MPDRSLSASLANPTAIVDRLVITRTLQPDEIARLRAGWETVQRGLEGGPVLVVLSEPVPAVPA